MKFAASLLILSALALTACNTLVTRRSDYSPGRGTGPWSETLRTQSYLKGTAGHPKETAAKATPAPAAPVSPNAPQEPKAE